jgi:acetylornithine deacetylase/succinyl-diaminopimelate desuccinylase-like protein
MFAQFTAFGRPALVNGAVGIVAAVPGRPYAFEPPRVLPGIDLAGSGSLASRVRAKPSATVLGIDAPSVADSANVLVPTARAKVGLRIAPGADAQLELERLTALLRARAPRWASVNVTPGKAAEGFEAPRDGPAMRAARTALRDVYGVEPAEIGGGGGIPLMRTLQRWSPDAGFVLWVPRICGPTRMARTRALIRPRSKRSSRAGCYCLTSSRPRTITRESRESPA